MNPGPVNGNLVQGAAEQIPAEWRVLSVAESRPLEITIRAETFQEWKGFWPYKFPRNVVVVEEAGRTLYFVLLYQDADSGQYECAIAQRDEPVIAVIHEDWQKQRAETRKLLGFIEYKAPSPEFAVTNNGGAEFCRIKTMRDAALSKHYKIYRMAFARFQYSLQETSGSGWPYHARWAGFRGESHVAETSRLAWSGVMLRRIELSLTSSEHLPPVLLLILTWWIDEYSERHHS